ncbi:hypothetical protein X975_22267, partial [Stegodyphus mimosarum]
MEEGITIDVSPMKFKGCLSYKQYNPTRRAKFGIKFYKLYESASVIGIILTFQHARLRKIYDKFGFQCTFFACRS